MDEIIEFIKRRFPKDCNWLDGNCYYFSKILHDRFETGKILYDVVYGHFLYEYKDNYYDWTGKVSKEKYNNTVPWELFKNYDEIQYKIIIRDCIL